MLLISCFKLGGARRHASLPVISKARQREEAFSEVLVEGKAEALYERR